MDSDKTVTATFSRAYVILASAGANGKMVPTGSVKVKEGGSQTFTPTPNTGYAVADVKVDGQSVGAVTSYTFPNVTTNHTISASFALVKYNLTINKAGTGNGTVLTFVSGTRVSTTSFRSGRSVTLKAKPNANSFFDGWSGGGCTGTSPNCTVTMNSDITVTATFNLKSYTITSTAGNNGSISPQGAVNVNHGSSQTFTITPDSGYRVADVKVDEVSKGAITSFTFPSVTANHTIEAVFALDAPANQPVFAVNCGGPQYTDGSGIVYSADAHYVGGSIYSNAVAIEGTEDDVLYQTERFGSSFSYAVPLPNGTYQVTLQFAEIYAYMSASGKRVFDVSIEGREVVSNLDLFAANGKYKAYNVTLPVTLTDGTLNIDFRADVGQAKVNAILVTKQ